MTRLKFVSQPHIGRGSKSNYKNSEHMFALTTAKVVRVHHRSGTADIELIISNDKIVSQPTNEGKFSARVVTECAYYDSVNLAAYGKTRVIRKDEIVIVAFLDGEKNRPIILGSLPDITKSERNLLPEKYPLNLQDEDDLREAWKDLTVYPNNSFKTIDGLGGIEWGHPNHSFLKIDHDFGTDGIADENLDDVFRYVDLNTKDPLTGLPREYKQMEASHLPSSILFAHESNFDENYSSWTKFYLSNTGDFRITKGYAKEPGINKMEMTKDHIKIVRSLDSTKPSDDGKDNLKIEIDKKGNFSATKTKGGKVVQGVEFKDEEVVLTQDKTKVVLGKDLQLIAPSGSMIMLKGDDIILKAVGKVIIEEG